MTETAFLVEPGWVRSVCVDGVAGSPPIRALFYEDGAVRIEHRCKVIDDTQIICAPKLQLDAGHSITSEDPLTITPSISCPADAGGCGLHGFITAGRWVRA